MFHKLGHKIKQGANRVGEKIHNAYRQGEKFMNKPAVKGALLLGAAAGGAALATRETPKQKRVTELQQSTNINNTGIGADFFSVPNAPNVKPFTEEAFPTMIFRE